MYKMQRKNWMWVGSLVLLVTTMASGDLSQAIRTALSGEFSKAQEQAAKLPAANTKAVAVRQWLSDHAKLTQSALAERQKEYDYCVERIGWAYLADKHTKVFEAKPYYKELRTLVRVDLADGFGDIGTSIGLEDAESKPATEIKTTSLKSIDESLASLTKITTLLAKETDDWAKEFQRELAVYHTQLLALKAAWTAVDTTTKRGRWLGARAVREPHEMLAEGLTDLEVLVAKKAWKVAMYYARQAKALMPKPDKIKLCLWYNTVMRDSETRGRVLIAKAEWIDALTCYNTLESLEPDSKDFKELARTVRRHVRVLQLFSAGSNPRSAAPADDDVPSNGDSGIEEEVDKDFWKEYVKGIDVAMVRRAIGQLSLRYVKPVDFRTLSQAALDGVRVLVKTPQVADTFPVLKDEKKLAKFLKELEREISDVTRKDRVDHTRMCMALNRVLDINAATLQLPVGVVVMEFTDGFLSKLDRFSSMVWPYDVVAFNKNMLGNFTGIGVQINKKSGEYLRVVTPLLGAPASKAGIKAGDLITKVGDVDTRTKTTEKLIKLISGPEGTKVSLEIKRPGIAKAFRVAVPRGAVKLRTVKGWQRRKDGQWDYMLDPKEKIGYIRLTQFTDTSYSNFRKALVELQQQGVQSLVLDLRDNPGGLLFQAVQIADEFLGAEQVIVSTRGRQKPRQAFHSARRGLYQTGDLVVLIDEGSASASEILSGAIKDLKRGMILGQRSYGKGSVQNVIPVQGEDAYLKLTTAYYYLPSGRLLHREVNEKDWGVPPDVQVELTPRQTRRWLSLRYRTDLLQEFDPALLKKDLQAQYQADIQLNTAVMMLRLMKLRRDATPRVAHAAAASKVQFFTE
ncbi:MAG: S41 family peptidase [Phycisphaerales bacterium]|jgi:carboxyl-terminal processing protease|nr:S41 family peptidase [Phycisphaerales bacterium]MBT7170393.1 S41 family peptidase [Phycisphaerales bacterium]